MAKGHATDTATISAILRLREEGVPVADIVAQTGASKSTVGRYPLPDASARDRVLSAVVEHGPLADVPALVAWTPDVDRHTAMHLLFALCRAGQVTFKEHRAGTVRRLTNIDATRRSRPTTNGHAVEPTAEPLAPAPEPRRPRYPALRAEVQRRADIEAGAAALERAGLDDLALSALAQVDGTPLVNEALALYRAAVKAGLTDEEVQP